MALQNLYIVRPNLGNPLILRPEQLRRFIVTFAYQIPWEMEEGDVWYPELFAGVPNYSQILSDLRHNPPKIFWENQVIELEVEIVGNYKKHPRFEANYGDVKHALTNTEQQYYNGFRWEIDVILSIDDSKIEELKNSIGWPTLLNLRYGSVNNDHAIYVHETLARSNEFTVLHITDTHISQRNDKIPELLAQVRNKRECEIMAAKYVNFNDNLRSFIKTANERSRAEAGKVIVALTGDIVDHYFDGYWGGKFICGQGEFAPDRRKEATGSFWGYSNVSKFREIILGSDGKGEPLICPLFTVLGNHDYLMNEVLLDLDIHLDTPIGNFKLTDRNTHSAFGLTQDEGREYDYWAYPRLYKNPLIPNYGVTIKTIAERKTFRENAKKDSWRASLDQDWSYWLAKPKSWQLSQYLRQISYDMDFDLTLGNHKLLFLNTGEDRYPMQEAFVAHEIDENLMPDFVRDYVSEGPHNRGITGGHMSLIQHALTNAPENRLLLVFSHAPLIGVEKDETKGIDVLFEDNHQKSLPPHNEISIWMSDLYGKTQNELIQEGFPLTGTRYFKRFKRYPLLNFSSADGKVVQFLDAINRVAGGRIKTPVFVFSGHTHKVHEFRIEKIREKLEVDDANFLYFTDNYSKKHFYKITNDDTLSIFALALRYEFIKTNCPFLFTSGALKNKTPLYREIIVKGQNLASLEMKEVLDIEKTTNYVPGCRHIALRANNGQYVSAERARTVDGELTASRNRIEEWETFEIIDLEGHNVAFKAYNGQFVRAENGGGGKLKPDKSWIKSHETFELIKRGGDKVALRANNGQYVCAEGGGGRELVANRNNIRAWETFELIELE